MTQLNTYYHNFLHSVSELLPGILGAIVILVLGLWLASVLSKLVRKAMRAISLDERVNKGGGKEFQVEDVIARIFYYFLVIYVLIIVLNMLGIRNVFTPLERMMQDFFAAIPNIIAAGIIGFAGYVIARLVSESIGFISDGVNNLTTKLGFDATKLNLIKLLKQLVFLVVFIPILIVAIDQLGMEAVSEPATAMLHKFMDAIPNIIAAALILGVFYLLAKFITPALRTLLHNLKVDELPGVIGLNFLGDRSLSGMLAQLAFFFIMLAGLISALERLEMFRIVDTMNQVLAVSGRIFFGLVIMTLGNFVASVAYRTMSASKDNEGLASIARIAVLGIFFGIGLSAMGIANSIVNLAFGLTLGAVAVAVALSFGLGGREAAGKQMEHILKRFRKES